MTILVVLRNFDATGNLGKPPTLRNLRRRGRGGEGNAVAASRNVRQRGAYVRWKRYEIIITSYV